MSRSRGLEKTAASISVGDVEANSSKNLSTKSLDKTTASTSAYAVEANSSKDISTKSLEKTTTSTSVGAVELEADSSKDIATKSLEKAPSFRSGSKSTYIYCRGRRHLRKKHSDIMAFLISLRKYRQTNTFFRNLHTFEIKPMVGLITSESPDTLSSWQGRAPRQEEYGKPMLACDPAARVLVMPNAIFQWKDWIYKADSGAKLQHSFDFPDLESKVQRQKEKAEARGKEGVLPRILRSDYHPTPGHIKFRGLGFLEEEEDKRSQEKNTRLRCQTLGI